MVLVRATSPREGRDHEFRLAERPTMLAVAAQAHRDLQGRKTVGSIVLVP
ncbi:MAG: hypothetical protein ACM3ML_12815 [Micromonosporaceae bacterium]